MIHAFKCLGQYLLCDVESGSVHMVDELIYDIALRFETESSEQIMRRLEEKYTKKEIEEGIEELEELKAQGLLCAKVDQEALEKAVARNKNVVKAMCLHVAHDCNLRCEYCFASTGDFHGDRALMPFSVAKAALDFLISHSGNRRHLEVDFFGGEPLMNFDVVKQTVAYGRELEQRFGKEIRFTITTNGVLLNDEITEYLDREMSNVVLSIDGREQIHDRMRKTVTQQPSFQIIAPKSLKVAQARKQERYYVRGTFTGYNKDFSKDVLFLADYGFKQLSMEPVVTDERDSYALRREDLPEIFAEYGRLAAAYLERWGTEKEFNFFHFMLDLTGGPCLPKRVTGCGAGNEYVAVTPTGEIYPCHQFVGEEGACMGSVLTGEFDTAAQARYKACNVLTKEKCRECWAKYYCSGGCAANAYHYNGDIYKPYDLACEMECKRVECALAIYALKKQRNS